MMMMMMMMMVKLLLLHKGMVNCSVYHVDDGERIVVVALLMVAKMKKRMR